MRKVLADAHPRQRVSTAKAKNVAFSVSIAAGVLDGHTETITTLTVSKLMQKQRAPNSDGQSNDWVPKPLKALNLKT
jgi:hypothetical protein